MQFHVIFFLIYLILQGLFAWTFLNFLAHCVSIKNIFLNVSYFQTFQVFFLMNICISSCIHPQTRIIFFFRSALGRARAWLRLALMQKKLADYFRHLLDQGDEVLSEFYEPRALLRSDEAAIVTGLLLSLNVVDCNLCVKVCVNN